MKLLNGNEVIAKPYQKEGAEEIVNLIVRNFKEVNVKDYGGGKLWLRSLPRMMWIGSYIMDTLESDVLFLSKGIAQITRNAMLVYPYIKSGVMSHGKAAEMLGLHKIVYIIFLSF